MNKRLVIVLIFALPLLLLSCQSYTSREGLASIQPLPPLGEEPIITKYSTLQEQKAEKENAILKAQQEKEAALAQAQEKKEWEALQEKLATLNEEKKTLLTQISQLKTAMDKQNKNLETAAKEIAQLKAAQEMFSRQAEGETQEYIQAWNEAQKTISDLTQENETLTLEQTEQKALIDELQSQNEAQAKELSQTQAERVLSALNAEEKYQAALQDIDALTEENAQLNQQILALQTAIEEKENAILQAELLAEQTTAEQTDLLKLAEEALEAERLALEKERMQIPPLSSITFPRIYSTEKESTLSVQGDKLKTIMLPLDDAVWKDPNMANEVFTSIKDLDAPVIFVTGHMENVIALVREMRSDAVLFSTGAIITSFPIIETSDFGVTVQYTDTLRLRLSLANLPQYEVLQAFLEDLDWQTLQKIASEERLNKLETITEEGSLTDPTLMGASLYEPSYQDWSTFSPVSYRQMDYPWPLCEALEQAGFYDTYRVTHFTEDTDAGNTLVTENWKERVDYLFSRKMIPLESSMLTIGGESVPDENNISRFGIFATYLVP